jgi:geranylgeranyl transferase type-1 subunit beta
MNDIGNRESHIKYFKRCLSLLPGRYSYLDSQRLVLSHFALGGLSFLGEIDNLENKEKIKDWIYSLQSKNGGFFGSDIQRHLSRTISQAHVAATFSAVQCLLILGDDLRRINVSSLLSWEGSTDRQ